MVTKNISLNIWENNYVTLQAQQGEVNSRYIKVSFIDQNSQTLSLAGKSVTIYALKPDKTQVFNTCTVSTVDNNATVELTSQFLSVEGMVECEFQIFEGDAMLLKVSGLKIIVFHSEDFSEAIESTSEYNALIEALNQAQTFMDNTGDVSDLTTTNKTSIIEAINELNSKTIPISQGGTGATTSSEARTNLEVLKAYVLYNNDSGNEGTVTLSDNADNYTFLDIIIWDFYVTRVYSRNSRPVGLMKIGGYGGNYIEWYSEAIAITGNTITRSGCTYALLGTDSSLQFEYTNNLPIRSVIGYKY